MTDRAIFDGIDKRIEEDGDSAYFEALTLKLEYLTKLVTAGLIACIGDETDRHRYSLEHRLVRADSVGVWAQVLNTALTGPASQFFLPASRQTVEELRERVGTGDWRHYAVTALRDAAIEVGCGDIQLGKRIALRQFFEIGAQIRNRSRGHGATTTEQKSCACPRLEAALLAVCENFQLFKLEWAYLHRNLSGKYRVSPLTGGTSGFNFLKRTNAEQLLDGVYVYLDSPVRVNLVFSNPDLHDIWLPNGNYKNVSFETLSYITNDSVHEDGGDWSLPVGQLPPSETEGGTGLEPFGKSFANVPPMLDDYVPRPGLVDDVVRELLETDRHPILSLTGPGGIGKTTVTIAALHEVSDRDDMPYEVILWISARDIDLLESGAKPVRPGVVTQKDIARAAVELLEPEERDSSDFSPTTYFEKCLQSGAAGPTLFVLDNFETVESPADVYSWLDTHIRPPNKVIITTRMREFRGDFPLDIGGMTDEQADQLIDQRSAKLNIGEWVSSSYKKDLISESDGHPYVIRIMLGQVAVRRQPVKPERIMAGSDRILRALFERTYNALDPGAQRAFLLLSSWRVFVPEVAIQAVLLRPGNVRFDVDKVMEQLHRFSLVEQIEAEEENQMLVGVPLTASIFGCSKLETSMFRASVEKDRELLMEFGPGRGKNARQRVLPRIENLYKYVASQAQEDMSLFEQYKPLLEFLADSLPSAFSQLSDLAWEINDSIEMKKRSIDYLRRYLEIAPPAERQEVWRRIAERCRASQDTTGEIHGLCEAALLSALNSDSDELGNYANRLNSRIREMRSEGIEEAQSSEVRDLLHKVIEAMELHLGTLTATNCSRLAWLYLNVRNGERARDVAQCGLDREPHNEYCQNLLQRLDG